MQNTENALYGKNVEFWEVTPGGAYGSYWVLIGYICWYDWWAASSTQDRSTMASGWVVRVGIVLQNVSFGLNVQEGDGRPLHLVIAHTHRSPQCQAWLYLKASQLKYAWRVVPRLYRMILTRMIALWCSVPASIVSRWDVGYVLTEVYSPSHQTLKII